MGFVVFITFCVIALMIVGSDQWASNEAAICSARGLDKHQSRKEEWAKQVSDRALEEDLRYFIADPLNYEKVWEEVHSAYLQMPACRAITAIHLHPSMFEGAYWKENFTKKQREKFAEENRRDALDIMLARRGKVRDYYTWTETSIVALSPGEGQHSRKVWDQTFDFWVYIRDELRRHGIDARLLFIAYSIEKQTNIPYDVDNIEEFHYKSGTMTWLPLTYYDENLRKM